MITLSQDQLQTFDETASRRFAARVVRHIERCFPRLAGEAEARARDALERGRALGFRSERQLLRFVNLSCVLGPGFEERSAWARAAVRKDAPADARLAALQRGASRALAEEAA